MAVKSKPVTPKALPPFGVGAGSAQVKDQHAEIRLNDQESCLAERGFAPDCLIGIFKPVFAALLPSFANSANRPIEFRTTLPN